MKRLSPEQITEINGRRYNTLKMRMTLLKVDAILRLQLLLWAPFILIVLFLYGFAPAKYPLHISLIWSVGFYLTHYVLVGLVRRMAETYLGKLCAHSGDARCKDLSVYENESLKPYRRADDPVLVRRAFKFTGALGLPSRGLGQMSVACFHFFALCTYVLNYAHYFGHADEQFAPTSLYLLHGVITAGGLLMIIKNAGYLISSQHILALLKGVIDWKILGEHGHVVHEEEISEMVISDSMPRMEKKELLAVLLALRERCPKFADIITQLIERLEQNPCALDGVHNEFMSILLLSPELMLEFRALNNKHEDKDQK